MALIAALERRAAEGDLMAELVLELGDVEYAVPRPRGMHRGRKGYCFANAERRACWHPAEATGYMYVEGYAIDEALMPLHHAWVSDGRNAIEVTWPEEGIAYMGIRFGCRERALLYLAYRSDAIVERLTRDVKGGLIDVARLPLPATGNQARE